MLSKYFLFSCLFLFEFLVHHQAVVAAQQSHQQTSKRSKTLFRDPFSAAITTDCLHPDDQEKEGHNVVQDRKPLSPVVELDDDSVLRREHERVRREKARRERDTANIGAVVEAIRFCVMRCVYVLTAVLMVVLFVDFCEDLIPTVPMQERGAE